MFGADGLVAQLIAVGVTLAGLAVFWRQAVRPLWRFASWLRHEVRDEMARRKLVDDLIDRELNHNGGSSMKDQASHAAIMANTAAEQANVAAEKATFAAAQLQDVKATQATIFVVLDRMNAQKAREHEALWGGLEQLGVTRNK